MLLELPERRCEVKEDVVVLHLPAVRECDYVGYADVYPNGALERLFVWFRRRFRGDARIVHGMRAHVLPLNRAGPQIPFDFGGLVVAPDESRYLTKPEEASLLPVFLLRHDRVIPCRRIRERIELIEGLVSGEAVTAHLDFHRFHEEHAGLLLVVP